MEDGDWIPTLMLRWFLYETDEPYKVLEQKWVCLGTDKYEWREVKVVLSDDGF